MVGRLRRVARHRCDRRLPPCAPAPPASPTGAASPRTSGPATSPRSRRWPGDADPSPLLGNLPGSIRHRSRIATQPCAAVGCGTAPAETLRGADEFVAVVWDELTELLAGELRRVVDTHGNEAIYGGSYGWASAGRFHHAQSQVHRFLKLLGGYTFSRHSYSLGATGVIMPRVVGTHDDLFKRSTDWDVIVDHTDLMVCFGGVALKNTAINHGGTTAHPARDALRRAPPASGWCISTRSGPRGWISPCRRSTSSGGRAGSGCRPTTG